ncbi:WD repeat-containing protein 19 [Cichlidogyrus casuarinus]|uniref:WD repeat-containing protein 19 n=1 Tax=Cichlidogyrus casuarinus TaxID=1844966 RepID=A0ABD2Q394_9PLAT
MQLFRILDTRGVFKNTENQQVENQNVWEQVSIPRGCKLVSLQYGMLSLLDRSNKINSLLLDPDLPVGRQKLKLNCIAVKNASFEQFQSHLATMCMILGRFEDALNTLSSKTDSKTWTKLAKESINAADFRSALHLLPNIRSPSNALVLNSLINCTDIHYCQGMAALQRGRTEEAQQFFLQSNNPAKTVDLYRDLLQWDYALRLAKTLDLNAVPEICYEYASELEQLADYAQVPTVYI